MAQRETSIGLKIVISMLLLFGLLIIASITAAIIAIFGNGAAGSGNVAIIPVEGVILASGESNSLRGVAGSTTLLDDIRKAEEDDRIKAILFRINSPGGSAVASDEVAAAIVAIEKPTAAVIREVGASGAYWIASASDHVVANRMSITGSIGVISSYLSFGDFIEDWNVTYNRLVAGDRKDVGTPFRELSPDETAYLDEKLTRIHEFFIISVAENRNMSPEALRPIADGSFYLGVEAMELGLVDEIGGEEEALAWLERTASIEAKTVEYTHEPTFLDLLSSVEHDSPLSSLRYATVASIRVPMLQ